MCDQTLGGLREVAASQLVPKAAHPLTRCCRGSPTLLTNVPGNLKGTTHLSNAAFLVDA